MKVKVYALVEKYIDLGDGRLLWDYTNLQYGHFSFWIRVPWPYDWSSSREDGWRVVLSQRFRVASLDIEEKFSRVMRLYFKSLKSSYLGKRGLRERAPLRPNPEIRYENRVIATEDTYTPYIISGTRVYQSFYRSQSSVSTPRSVLKKGTNLPVNPYSSRTIITHDGQACNVAIGDDSGYSRQWDSTTALYPGWMPGVPGVSYDSGTYNRTLRKLIDGAELDIAGNLAQDFAQIGQTVNLIKNSCDRIKRTVLALRKGWIVVAVDELLTGRKEISESIRKKMHPSKTKTLANNWLELQYGWKPLLMDIHGSIRSIAALMAKDENIRTVSASSKNVTKVVQLLSEPLHGYQAGSRTYSRQNICRIGVRYKVDSHLTTFLAQTGFTNLPNLAWEVLPFSFVMDWFLPIGPWLSTLSAWDGLAFVDGYVTQYKYSNDFLEVRTNGAKVPPFYNIAYSHGGAVRREIWDMDRTKLTSFPSGRFPRFKNPVSTTHALNAMALMGSAFAGELKRAPDLPLFIMRR
jgi:hypothetical protein